MASIGNETWALLPSATPEHLGFIPYWIDTQSLSSFVDQINAEYGHGGGWQDFVGFDRSPDGTLSYPEDPDMRPIAMVASAREILTMYDHSWVCVYDIASKTHRVARID